MENHTYVDQGDTSEKPEPIIIRDLVVNTEVHGWLLAEEVQHRTTKNGKQYRQFTLRDLRDNTITARQFDLPHREMSMPQAGTVVVIKGLIEE